MRSTRSQRSLRSVPRRRSKNAQRPPLEFVVSLVQRAIERVIHHLEFFELQIGDFEHVEHVVRRPLEVHDQGGIPIDHDQIGFLERRGLPQDIGDLGIAQALGRQIGEQAGDLEPAGRQANGSTSPSHFGSLRQKTV